MEAMRLIDADAFRRWLANWQYGEAPTLIDNDKDREKAMLKCEILDIILSGLDDPYFTIETEPVKHEEWILCSERLPKDDSWVIVTVFDEHGDTPFIYTDFGWYLEAANCWIVDAEQREDVMAWMPLPRPYKGSDTE